METRGAIRYRRLLLVAILIVFSLLPSSLIKAQVHPNKIVLAPPTLKKAVSIVAVGDVMLGSWVIANLDTHGVLYPFEATIPYVESGDLAIANLEAPFTEAGEPFPKQFNFKVPRKYAAGIKQAGFDVVTLANNHIMDFGDIGLISTIKTLQEMGIQHCGAGMNLEEAHSPAIVEVNGIRVAFFGYSMTFPTEFYAKKDSAGTAYPEPDVMRAYLQSWEDRVDYTVVSFHWSAEKREIPKDYQIYFARLAIDSGADLVLGHHPHVLQGLEIYKNRLIAYSLGNFAFGSYSAYAVDSIILKVHLNDDGLLYAQCIPLNVDNREVEFQPKVVSESKRGEAILDKLRHLSRDLNDGQNIILGRGLILGDWRHFYHDWLLSVATSSYLRTPFAWQWLHYPESTNFSN